MNFNGAQIHLLLNHLPVVIPGVGLLLLVFGLAQGKRDKTSDYTRAGLAVIVFGALTAIPTYLTGGPAAHVLKAAYAGFDRAFVHEHAEAAEYALTTIEIAGGAALMALVLGRRLKKRERLVHYIVAFLTLFSLTTLVRTAHLGGLVHHEEIRVPAAPGTHS